MARSQRGRPGPRARTPPKEPTRKGFDKNAIFVAQRRQIAQQCGVSTKILFGSPNGWGGPHPLVTNVTKTWLITNTLYTVILSFCAKTGTLLSFDSQSHSLHIPLVAWTMCPANAVCMCSWASPSSQSCQSKKSEPPRGARPEQRTRSQSNGQEPGQESRQRRGRADNQ